jgi:hypothetical protein
VKAESEESEKEEKRRIVIFESCGAENSYLSVINENMQLKYHLFYRLKWRRKSGKYAKKESKSEISSRNAVKMT